MSETVYPFQVGKYWGYLCTDGHTFNVAEKLFVNAPSEPLQDVLSEYELTPNKIPSWFHPMIVNTGEQWILFDTGVGHDETNSEHGFLYHNLKQVGVQFSEIDFVVISHAHGDHIACNTDENGNPLFPNAQYVMMQKEWVFWTDAEMLKRENFHTNAVRRNLMGIQERVILIDGEYEVVPGIHFLPTPGHTPGHSSFLLESDGQTLIYAGDAFLNPIHVEYPEWAYHIDVDREQSLASRERLIQLALDTDAIMTTYHFPFPALGRIERKGDRAIWQPVG